MSKYKIIYGTDATGSYCDLYKQYLFIYFPIAGLRSTGNREGEERARKWANQYNIPLNRIKQKNV